MNEKKEKIVILVVLLFILSYLIVWDYDKLIREPREMAEKERSEQSLKYLELEQYGPLEWTFTTPTTISAEELNEITLGVGATIGEISILPKEGADHEGQILTIDDSNEVFDLTIVATGAEWASSVPITQIIIEGDDGEDIGVLDWSTGKLKFSGKMSSSARSFFKYFLKPYVDEYIAGELDKKYNVSILSHEEAFVLKDEPPIGTYAYIVKDMPWPIRPSLFAGKFIEWLYTNDYEIVKRK